MNIKGQLKDDISKGNVVLFLGAGASQAAGLLGGQDLAGYLYEEAESPAEYNNFKNDISRLVAKLDKDPNFTRRWVNNHLIGYFLDTSNYKTLDYHEKIFQLNLQAVFTTNYDICIELAEHKAESRRSRLVPIVNSAERNAISDVMPGKLKYFKIHGCARGECAKLS